MKKFSITINSDHLFRGRATGKANQIARLIYGAKFFNNQKCLDALIDICCADIDASKFDTIVPVQTRDSSFGLPQKLAYAIADKMNLTCLRALSNQNTIAHKSLYGKKILIIDDVIYTGRTMKKAIKACEQAHAKYIQFFAIAHSKRFIFDTSTGSLQSAHLLPKPIKPTTVTKKTTARKSSSAKLSKPKTKGTTTYKATLLHDKGKFTIKSSAADKKAFVEKICKAENCPPSAITNIRQVKS